jgi:hypothetical protein
MFGLAIDGKLCGCDVVAIRVEYVAAEGYTADRARSGKEPGRPIPFELSERIRQSGYDYLTKGFGELIVLIL